MLFAFLRIQEVVTPVFTAVVCCTLGILYYVVIYRGKIRSDIPWIALNEHGLMDSGKARMQWITHCRDILDKGITQVQGAFQAHTGDGPMIILPNRHADEIRNNPDLLLSESTAENMFAGYPGFEPFALIKSHNVIQDVVRLKLTRSLDAITPELTAEANRSLERLLGNSDEWKAINLKPIIYKFVARLSSRVFLGEEVCNNEKWPDICVSYTMDSFSAARVLRTWSPLLRPIVHWFIPECCRVRRERDITRVIVTPIVQERMARRKKAEGGASETADMVGWIDDVARSKSYAVRMEDAQLFLAIAAIHTTTEALSYLMLDLLDHPEIIPRLKEEIISVLKDGWKKASLQQMKYLDSILKESQRLHKLSMISMERKAMKTVTLSDGTTIPKGAKLCVNTDFAFKESIYPSPHAFQSDRFLQKREAGESNKWQYVTTSPEHLGFGHGRHACPGRFFASNEIKIALIHLLLKYDWKYSEEGKVAEQVSGPSAWVPVTQKVIYRRREEEVKIDG
ncbi:cytochrome P450 [Zopfia rhizophila CBS 207.26]|uniref:Cytochrome P450 n=1 Tax=Zopfia rhizophila CBS 207.26 TaxID=1314779 RepID=A0A6A6DVN9_9PEZI|nr:cytochrome P450 [Zopfia rhizophila CBS 207.26]